MITVLIKIISKLSQKYEYTINVQEMINKGFLKTLTDIPFIFPLAHFYLSIPIISSAVELLSIIQTCDRNQKAGIRKE